MDSQMRYLEKGEQEKSRKLWSLAFPEDSEEFKDYYFKEKAKSSRILVKEENGEIFSMLHRNPYRIRLGEGEQTLDYIVGVATEPQRRHQGHMRDLLKQALSDARREGQAFCFLMPAAEAIYTPFGFRFVYDQPFPILAEEEALEITRKPASEEKNLSELSAFMEQWMAKRYQVYAVRDEKYTKGLVDELASEAGFLERIYAASGKLTGLRAFWGLEEREQRFFYMDGKTKEEKPPKPAIMARIADLRSFLSLTRLKEGTEKTEGLLWIEDSFLEENRGLWIWKVDEKGASAEKAAGGCNGDPFVCDVSQMVQWLLGYRDWSELMPGKRVPDWMRRIERVRGIYLDEVV